MQIPIFSTFKYNFDVQYYEYSNPGISQTNRKIYGTRMTPKKKKTASVLALYEVYTNHRYDKQQKSTIFHIPSYKEEFQVK